MLRYTGDAGQDQQRHVHRDGAGHGRGHRRCAATTTDSPHLAPAARAAHAVTCARVTSAVDRRGRHERPHHGRRPGRQTTSFSGLTTIPVIDHRRRRQRRARRRRARRHRSTAAPATTTIDGFAGNDTLARRRRQRRRSRPTPAPTRISGGDGIDTVVYGLRVSPVVHARRPGQRRRGRTRDDLIGTDVENVTAPRLLRRRHARRRRPRQPPDGAPTAAATSPAATAPTSSRAARSTTPSTPATASPTRSSATAARTPCAADTHRHDLAQLRDRLDRGHARRRVRRPPAALAWDRPAANGSLSANAADQARRSTPADDRGVAKVHFYDDDRLLCEVTAAPFDCAYAPRGGDVGRNTLIAVAVDGAGQTTSVVRAVTVRRFTTPARDALAAPEPRPQGALLLPRHRPLTRPAAVSPSQGCSGTVTISAKKGTKTVATHRTIVNRNCEYETTVRFRSRLASKLRLIAKFAGNDVLSGHTAAARTVRLG